MTKVTISVVIPTYNRGAVLLDTIDYLEKQETKASEILIVDQTHYAPDDEVKNALKSKADQQVIQWWQLPKPSIPAAMNFGLLKARSEYVLFLDDDVSFEPDFISQHMRAVTQYKALAHVGQIIQPWQDVVALGDYQQTQGLQRDLNFPFNCDADADIHNCMAGNLCVHRQSAIQVGGFDQNFAGAAYRFETEFCRRMIYKTGQAFKFIPSASLNHLYFKSGGTRNKASHLTSISSDHSVGDYYFAQLAQENKRSIWAYCTHRFIRSIVSKFYLKKPWWIPIRVIAELKGFCRSRGLIRAGQKLIDQNQYI